eukprot:tig00000704_g3334.t1
MPPSFEREVNRHLAALQEAINALQVLSYNSPEAYVGKSTCELIISEAFDEDDSSESSSKRQAPSKNNLNDQFILDYTTTLRKFLCSFAVHMAAAQALKSWFFWKREEIRQTLGKDMDQLLNLKQMMLQSTSTSRSPGALVSSRSLQASHTASDPMMGLAPQGLCQSMFSQVASICSSG